MIKKAGNVLKYYEFYTLILAFVFAGLLTRGYFIGGLDGGLYMLTDSPVHLYSWFEGNFGSVYPSHGMHVPLYFVRLFFSNVYVYQFFFYVFLFYAVFIGIKLLFDNIGIGYFINKTSSKLNLILSLIYLFNPISLTYRLGATTANGYMFFLLPLCVGIVFRYLSNPNFRRLVVGNIVLIFMSFIWLNFPSVLVLILFVFILSILTKKKISDLFSFGLVFLCFNMFWILTFFVLMNTSLSNTIEAINPKGNIEYLANILGYRHILFSYPSEHWGANDLFFGYYKQPFIQFLLSITLGYIFFLYLFQKRVDNYYKYKYLLFSCFLLFIDISSPSGFFASLVKNNYQVISFLAGFRTAFDKVGYFLIFYLLFFVYYILKTKKDKDGGVNLVLFYFILFIYVLVNFYPFLIGGVFINKNNHHSQYKIPSFYLDDFFDTVDKDIKGNILVIPWYDYDRSKTNFGYLGLDPLMTYEKKFVSSFGSIQPTISLYKKIKYNSYDKEDFLKYGINGLFIRKDADIEDLRLFSGFLISSKNLYTNLIDDYLFLFKEKVALLNLYQGAFIQINPTKYHLTIKNLSGSQNVSFLQSYHDGWKLYSSEQKVTCPLSEQEIYNSYDYLTGDAATYTGTVNLTGLIQTGDSWEKLANEYKLSLSKLKNMNPTVSVLQEGEEIIVGTKQEKIYPDFRHEQIGTGNITECINKDYIFFEGEELQYLRKQQLFDDTHQLVNDYANGRMLDADYIKKNFPKEYYKENPDGSIDINLTLYFKPQSYFYLGLGVSGITFLSLITWLIIDWRREKKRVLSVKIEGKQAEH